MHSLNFIEIGMGDAFIGSAQVFTDVSAEIIDPRAPEVPGRCGRGDRFSLVKSPTVSAVRMRSRTSSRERVLRSVR